MIKKKTKYNEVVDQIEAEIVAKEPVVCPLKHYFTPGLYSREIFIPAGTILTSKIHKTEHPYVVSLGKVAVIKEDDGVEIIEAPHFGITMPGTRRVLHTITDVIWTTFHPTAIMPKSGLEEDVLKAVDAIEAVIIEPYTNELISNKKEELT